MIPVYGSLITILVCMTIPPLIDKMSNKSEKWSWKRASIAYGVITVFVLVVPVMTSAEQYILLIMLVLAVAVAALIGPLTYLGTSTVLLLSTVVLPILILWDITRYQGIKEPMKFVLKAMKWHEMAVSVVLGLMTLLITRNVQQRLKSRK
ncbi:hypothetical protein Geob_0991 [Geotalea daltonii FRC-32]|uniref:Uncharacterized protein n=1 Tax=Geotalea daltonii (strain DSM 22248 / JCM 15807 / FRC-32) TaxID=316067 RepID=B9M2H4_GEODF|nr:hypothetical protein [Geotalea daltonii]ACM19353.1 hypothetical protein Geob_0991 [Geotalea daltonii FRC-32]